MPIDVRGLFGTIGVEWRDTGPNTSRGQITIRCPWCGDADYSGHLKVSESKEAFLCMRNSRHAGYHLDSLLRALGMSYDDATQLRRQHIVSRPPPPTRTEQQEIARRKEVSNQWLHFKAADSARCLDYLQNKRGFRAPLRIARDYDLRFASAGAWACRLLLPLPEQYDVESWVGRAMINDLEPKYRMESDSGHGLIYMPRGPRSTLEIVEGPMDALKLAVATEEDDHFCLALLGKQLSDEKCLRLMVLCKNVQRVFVALDNDAAMADSTLVANRLQHFLPHCDVIPRRGLPYYKDPGETPLLELRRWAGNLAA